MATVPNGQPSNAQSQHKAMLGNSLYLIKLCTVTINSLQAPPLGPILYRKIFNQQERESFRPELTNHTITYMEVAAPAPMAGCPNQDYPQAIWHLTWTLDITSIYLAGNTFRSVQQSMEVTFVGDDFDDLVDDVAGGVAADAYREKIAAEIESPYWITVDWSKKDEILGGE
ncbi:hypothetical protein BT63DRAFT_410252 [Microthyrium microscopicum]|uniref:Uncharacterized protein n=1 Tax=Microthyrium microscopicum TaxID=703497 RepID=A0A6A6ULV3_9PEZI|nr:hypothetical protein BT63DRAFT_410252 [Microthyrium microscopicum]